MVSTTLRSTPCGRVGLEAGSSPAAIRSVQSANIFNARLLPMRPSAVAICVSACPDWMRRCQASSDDLKSPSSFGIARMALLPRA
jgi:hypothetical protein